MLLIRTPPKAHDDTVTELASDMAAAGSSDCRPSKVVLTTDTAAPCTEICPHDSDADDAQLLKLDPDIATDAAKPATSAAPDLDVAQSVNVVSAMVRACFCASWP